MKLTRAGIATFLLVLVACEGMDPVVVDCQSPPCDSPVRFLPLDERDNLLANLELAYGQRNFEQFRRLLDPSEFIFYFSPTDVFEGNVTNSQWDIAQELASTQKLFDLNPPPGQPYANSIALDMAWASGDDDWQPVIPATHPDEVWYEKAVEYFLEVKVGTITYTQNRAIVALFTMRYTEASGDSVWQIVRWRDDVGN